MSEFFYRSGPNEYGPLTSNELRKLADAGRLSADVEIRKGRTGKWFSAAHVQGLFSALPMRRDDLAINEMDVVTSIQDAAPIDSDFAEQAGRDTAVDSPAQNGQSVAAPTSESAAGSRHKPVDRREVLLVHWATAVAGTCYFASFFGMVLGIIRLFGDQTLLHHIFIGICFLFALFGLAGGCAISLLLAKRGR